MDLNPEQLPSRKMDHIRINLEEDVDSTLTTGFEKYTFLNQALPELNLDQVDTSTELFGKHLQIPLLISSMTGGTQEAGRINYTLAEAAQACGIAMGLGSQRPAIENPELSSTFQVRKVAPDILLFANLGAVQLNYGYGIDQCRRAVEMVGADALVLHLNALQEALQPEGDTNFKGILLGIGSVCRQMDVPVIVKEVGWGISGKTARDLVEAGVAAIDVAGAGGTSWSQVEMYRIQDVHRARVAAAFRKWGIPTLDALRSVRAEVPDVPALASGGLRDGIDLAKAIACGASVGGMAGPFLKAAAKSVEEVVATIQEIATTLRIAMFCGGAGDIPALKHTPLVELK
jgi:isopentenyl-diphosphate delta-isomerase